MPVTSDQCRAGRSLLNWSQDELATNARVSRATVADFECNPRQPMKNNILAIEDCMFAAGIEFLPEDGQAGVGVRFRERKLEFIKTARPRGGELTIPMRYAGHSFTCVVPREVIDDLPGHGLTAEREPVAAVRDILHILVAAVERRAKRGFDGDQMVVTFDMIDPQAR